MTNRTTVLRAPYLFTLAAFSLLCGFGSTADAFFSGRPSGMSQVHNRVIAGGPPAVNELLRVPARFPDAQPAHIRAWQDSVAAWWAVPEKRQWMAALMPQLPPAEQAALGRWLQARHGEMPGRLVSVLEEVARAR